MARSSQDNPTISPLELAPKSSGPEASEVKDEYIVMLNPSISAAVSRSKVTSFGETVSIAAKDEVLAHALSGSIDPLPNRRVDDLVSLEINDTYALNSFVVNTDSKTIDDLRCDPNVLIIESDQVVSKTRRRRPRRTTTTIKPTTQPASNLDCPVNCVRYDVTNVWGLDRVDQLTKNRDGYMTIKEPKEGVDIYVLDTGIDRNHPEFEGRAYHGTTTVYAPGSDSHDVDGHGTHVAATVAGKTYGIAKKARIFAVKVLGDNGGGTTSSILRGLQWVRQQTKRSSRRSVINMSLGGRGSKTEDAWVNALASENVPVVVAAGNSHRPASYYSPSRATGVFTVAASDWTDNLCSFSNYGKSVDIIAPGEQILSAIPGNRAVALSGTSMASPHVAGIVADYLSHYPDKSTAQVKSWLQENSIKSAVYLTKTENRYTVNYLAKALACDG
ncbi:unnamed protein product [Owenia fusiformis]|uniref:Uncharacterized protein n=1 Tax=Owenia fusiformis TaxID=6347 RepID=A0A8J1UGP7_OWEFU|nr:unnamed protein product [Owenia fusiformis]